MSSATYHAANLTPQAGLGSAIFTISANASPFLGTMQQVQQQAQKTAKAIGQDLKRGADQAGQALGQNLKKSTDHAALGFLELSRAVEDAQYGFSAIVNNIPQMVLMFGGGAGLAAGISLASVALSQLIKHFDDFKDAVTFGWSSPVLGQLKEMREKTEEATAAFEKLAKTPSEAGKAWSEGIGKNITEVGAENMKDMIAKALTASGRGVNMTEDQRQSLKAVKNADPKFKAAVEKRIFEPLLEANKKEAERMIGEMSQPGGSKSKGAQTIAAMIKEKPQMFPAGFLGDIERLDPEEQKRQAKLEQAGALQGANQQHVWALRREEEKRRREMQAKMVGVREAMEKEVEHPPGEEDQRRKEMRQKMFQNEERMAKERKDMFDEEDKRARSMRDAKAKGRDIKYDVRDIMKEARKEEFQPSKIMGQSEFRAMTATGILNSPVEIAKKQLTALEKIQKLMEDNPMYKGVIARAVGPA